MSGCEHTRTEFLMRRDGVDYLRCTQCDAVFESEDLDQIPTEEDDIEETPGQAQRRRKKAS
jgi:hypothetical protein